MLENLKLPDKIKKILYDLVTGLQGAYGDDLASVICKYPHVLFIHADAMKYNESFIKITDILEKKSCFLPILICQLLSFGAVFKKMHGDWNFIFPRNVFSVLE